MAFRVLIAEDEKITLDNLIDTLRDEGYEASGAGSGIEALGLMATGSYDLLVTDIKMPGMGGMELLSEVREKYPETEVIVITGYGSIGSAVEATKKGAFDYITKPFDLEEMVLKIGKLREQKAIKKENMALKAYIGMDKKISIIAKSPAMTKILEVIESIKGSDCNVIFTGESGVGKNLIAKIIHFTSRRQEMPFLSINCATLTEELLASELFGHEKGAFTGAIRTKQGLIEVADTGTLLLDEVAEMPPSLQAKLLKVIEEGEFYRVGGTKPIRVDVRFLAATNRNVRQLISEGKFREDLYYRLNVMEISIPPLRERKEDIAPLSMHFLEKHIPSANKKMSGFTKEAMKILMNYSFPGNVRELENIVERAIILEKSPLITPESLPQTIKMFQIETLEPDKIKPIDDLVKEYSEQVVELLGGNRSKAAELLGISRTSLWRILKEE